MIVCVNQSEASIILCWPIRSEYLPDKVSLSVNNQSPLGQGQSKACQSSISWGYNINQSEVRIMVCQPIRKYYYVVSTNQSSVLTYGVTEAHQQEEANPVEEEWGEEGGDKSQVSSKQCNVLVTLIKLSTPRKMLRYLLEYFIIFLLCIVNSSVMMNWSGFWIYLIIINIFKKLLCIDKDMYFI